MATKSQGRQNIVSPATAAETGLLEEALEDVKLCTKDEHLSAAKSNQIEQAFQDVLNATEEFSSTFEGSEEQQQSDQSSKPHTKTNLHKATQAKETSPQRNGVSSTIQPPKIVDEASGLSKKHAIALEQIFSLLQSPDDTTKFIGLALLRGVLTKIDSKEMQESYRVIAPKCWNAIPVNFLDRLFNQFTKMVQDDTSAPDARPMFELAFNVTHAFVCLLSIPENRHALMPENMSKQLTTSWTKRVEFIFGLLDRPCEQQLHDPALQILQLFSDIPEGASFLIGVKDWAPLFKHADRDDRPLEIYVRTFSTLAEARRGKELVSSGLLKKMFNQSVNQAIPVIENMNCEEELWDAMNEVIVAINDPEVQYTPGLERKKPPTWYPKIIAQIRRSPYAKRNMRKVRTEGILLAVTLLKTYHALRLAKLLFIPYSDPENINGNKPRTYDFVVMLISEITESVTKYDKLSKHSKEYPQETVRLRSYYELLCCFIGYLVGRESAETPQNPVKPLLPPDLLLDLRKLISELMQVSILTIRTRFGSPGTPIKLQDPVQEAKLEYPWNVVHEVTCGQLRTLSLWLRDDDGDKVRKEAASIMDVLLQIISQGKSLDISNAVIMCLEGICQTSAGTKAFQEYGGWQIVTEELDRIVKRPVANYIGDTYLGEQITIVFYNVVHQTGSSPPKATTAKILQVIASIEQDTTQRAGLQIELLSLASKLLEHTPPTQRKHYAKVSEKIISAATALYYLGGPTKENFHAALMGLTEVAPTPGISV